MRYLTAFAFDQPCFSCSLGVKQFVVTNCSKGSKERPGSTVTETLKNRNLIPIVT